MPDYAAQIPPRGPLGHRGLHPRAPVQPARRHQRRAAGGARQARTTGVSPMTAIRLHDSRRAGRATLQRWRTRSLVAGVVAALALRRSDCVLHADAVLPLLPVVVHVRASALTLGSPGVADAAVPDRRRLGHGDPAAVRRPPPEPCRWWPCCSSRCWSASRASTSGRTPNVVAHDEVLQHKARVSERSVLHRRAVIYFAAGCCALMAA